MVLPDALASLESHLQNHLKSILLFFCTAKPLFQLSELTKKPEFFLHLLNKKAAETYSRLKFGSVKKKKEERKEEEEKEGEETTF